MEGKFEGPKGMPIRKRREAIESTESEALLAEGLPEKHAVKHEMYALASFLIERYHQKAKEIFENDPAKALHDLQASFLINREFAEAIVLNDQNQIVFDEKGIEQVEDEALANALRSEMVFPKMYIRAFDDAFVQVREAFDSKEQAVYKRLGDLFYNTQTRLVARGGGKVSAQSVEGFVKTGVVTAATESWNIMLALTKKYNQEFHTELTSEQLDTLTPDIKKVLNQVASLHITDFGHLRDLAIEPGQVDLRQVAWDKILEFGGEFPRVRVGLKEEYRNVSDPEQERRECTVGCPGRDAIVTNDEQKKVNVVGDVFDIHKDLAKRVMLPIQRVLL